MCALLQAVAEIMGGEVNGDREVELQLERELANVQIDQARPRRQHPRRPVSLPSIGPTQRCSTQADVTLIAQEMEMDKEVRARVPLLKSRGW